MNTQPSMDANERYGLPPEQSIPYISLGEEVGSREEALNLENPVQPDDHSLKNGGMLYGAFWQVCHGSEGNWMVPVAAKFIPAPNIIKMDK